MLQAKAGIAKRSFFNEPSVVRTLWGLFRGGGCRQRGAHTRSRGRRPNGHSLRWEVQFSRIDNRQAQKAQKCNTRFANSLGSQFPVALGSVKRMFVHGKEDGSLQHQFVVFLRIILLRNLSRCHFGHCFSKRTGGKNVKIDLQHQNNQSSQSVAIYRSS